MKDIIHFVHGNGFPSPCYRQFLQALEGRFDCYYIDRVGHLNQQPVSDNWQSLVDELIDAIKTEVKGPVIGVGHSLGGVLNVLAAIENPQLFKYIVLLDSPMMGRFKSRIIKLSKLVGVIDRVTPAWRTRGRRTHWKMRDQALSYLKSKALFSTFTDACLNDYIDYGMEKTKDGYALRFDSRIEYQIYRTIPHAMYELEGQLNVPTALIYGRESHLIDSPTLRYMKKQYGVINYPIEGTHMFPMEHPEEAAALVIKAIDDFNRTEGLRR